jgi:hypothetical protein
MLRFTSHRSGGTSPAGLLTTTEAQATLMLGGSTPHLRNKKPKLKNFLAIG